MGGPDGKIFGPRSWHISEGRNSFLLNDFVVVAGKHVREMCLAVPLAGQLIYSDSNHSL